MSLATERYKSIRLYNARREMLEALTKKIDSRGPKSVSPKEGPDPLLPFKKALMKWAKERGDASREGASDWTSYTDYQDYRPAPTNYSYLDNPPWGG